MLQEYTLRCRTMLHEQLLPQDRPFRSIQDLFFPKTDLGCKDSPAAKPERELGAIRLVTGRKEPFRIEDV
jgi:hypothetical protein